MLWGVILLWGVALGSCSGELFCSGELLWGVILLWGGCFGDVDLGTCSGDVALGIYSGEESCSGRKVALGYQLL
ncbi:MAG TPA: hypothetical protein P5543_10855 [Planctomycetota bacterium]|nr:hypothetical protein [Planctomycetota bacterium]HRU52676.1 hypothetical protein [Planctomycetota bacterium]